MSVDLKELAERIKGLTVIELIELFRELLGASGWASGAAPSDGAPPSADPPARDPNVRYEVIILKAGDRKVEVIKAVREITGLGLKEAKDLVEAAPKTVKEWLSWEEANEAAERLMAAGATAEIKPMK